MAAPLMVSAGSEAQQPLAFAGVASVGSIYPSILFIKLRNS
jgi:hypothetical protein